MSKVTDFERDGYTVIDNVLDAAECARLISLLPPIKTSGSRALLSLRSFQQLVHDLSSHKMLLNRLSGLVAVQCTLFRKTLSHNWAVRLHRDSVLPISGDGPWASAGRKEGMRTVKPPRELLDQCIVARVHLDGAPNEDVSVVPGSHLDAKKRRRSDAIAVAVRRGGALIMRPTVEHASSKLHGSPTRRVLHYLFARPDLPFDYKWYYSI